MPFTLPLAIGPAPVNRFPSARFALAASLMLTAATLMSACGGGGGEPSDNTGVEAPDPTRKVLAIQRLELAQTHLLPDGSKSWSLPTPVEAPDTLHLVGNREALVLVRLSATDADQPMIEGLVDGRSLGTVALKPPALLPPTEASGPAYATDLHSAVLPAGWLRPGLALRVAAANYSSSAARSVEVGADMPFTLRILPFYLYGATESNTGRPLASVGTAPADAIAEMFAKWPVSRLDVANHPGRKVQWPELVIGPREDANDQPQAAYVARSTSDYKEGFAGLTGVLGALIALREASGEGPLPVQYYAPLISLNASGSYSDPGGGLGGGGLGGNSAGAGDERYAGIFIHEQGHAFGLPHVGDAYDAGRYPYAWGSLNGSAWGYDATHQEFLAPFVPTTAPRYANCKLDIFAGRLRALDTSGRCVKQDPMQSGAGDEARGYRYASFSDFSTAVMQRYLEGWTTVDANGRHAPGGRVVPDASFPSGYKQWDTLDKRWIESSTATRDFGQGGLDRNLPWLRDVPVHAIVLTISNAGTSGVTQIYPPFSFVGNLLRGIDPSSASDRASILPSPSSAGTAAHRWYCNGTGDNAGCDFTLRLTYADGSVSHRLLRGGFRPFNQPGAAAVADSLNPLKGASFRVFAVHVPGDKALTKIELLDTPKVWEGLPLNPRVMASRAL